MRTMQSYEQCGHPQNRGPECDSNFSPCVWDRVELESGDHVGGPMSENMDPNLKVTPGSRRGPRKRPSSAASTPAAHGAKAKKAKANLCPECGQDLDGQSLSFYQGHPPEATEEFVALTHEALSLGLVMDDSDALEDPRQYYRVTQFNFYDREGHLVALDQGVVETGKELLFSGFLKVVTDDSPLADDGIPVRDAGPLEQWWIHGFEEGSTLTLGVSTDSGHYFLSQPSKEYKPFMAELSFKGHLAKLAVEFMMACNRSRLPIEYEDLLASLEGESHPELEHPINEDALIRHGNFILAQVQSLEEAGDYDEDLYMMESDCVAALIERSGLRTKPTPVSNKPKRIGAIVKKLALSKATTTPLVRSVFERLFGGQFAEPETVQTKQRRCQVCPGCMLTLDCGQCSSCQTQAKRRGAGAAVKTKRKNKIAFQGSGTVHDQRTYFSTVTINGAPYQPGDFALFSVQESRSEYALYIRRIETLFKAKTGQPRAHVQWFQRSEDTCLGETGRLREIFQILYCEDVDLDDLQDKAHVQYWNFPDNLLAIGGTEEAIIQPPQSEFGDNAFFYRMRYEGDCARFEAAIPWPKSREDQPLNECSTCPHKEKIEDQANIRAEQLIDEHCDDKGRFQFKTLRVFGTTVSIDDGIFIKPHSVPSAGKPTSRDKGDSMDARFADATKYPEYYRVTGHVKGSNVNTPKPFQIGIVQEILAHDQEGMKKVKVLVRKLFRPEDTCLSRKEVLATDLNLLYWSDVFVTVDGTNVQGQCFIRPECSLSEPREVWTREGRYRFYFAQAYNRHKREFQELEPEAEMYGSVKNKGKGKCSAQRLARGQSKGGLDEMPRVRPLRCLDVFAGCGGLSHGLHEAGIATSDWAIEVYEPAARAFKANNPEAVVFTDDCNVLLKKIIEGEKFNDKKQPLPQKGEVEMLIGGPPCQGYSGMNRFSHGAYSSLKNSLVSSYLSYLDYFRPKYFILENVRNFASFQKSAVLRLCQSVILQMGYSCTFGVLQCGNYGVPQTRRRLILLAAAPGYELPNFPEPQHVFTHTPLSVQIENTVFKSNTRWTESAPYRTITVSDTTSDLPPIASGSQEFVRKYEDEPQTPFQRLMRRDVSELRDHVCKKLLPIVEARMTHIPTEPGADWRCLPNIVVQLSNGSFSEKLNYPYEDFKQKRSPTGAKRGVCTCQNGDPSRKCEESAKQTNNTLIPWCLPHTSNRHNQWAGLYGRLEMAGYFSTTVTNPEPMGKQGRVLHPVQDRVVSVRECARSQGFPDSYIFAGNVLEKHRQVGNAVPPPLGRHLGLEIRKALAGSRGADNDGKGTQDPTVDDDLDVKKVELIP
eukprot:maker-scaffold253_size237113-snap-gene-1.26 protein:Tk00286 transcript:maker-scaffold253_size237113-snap-gene-1.26-mRNA-1 annotation:"dna cytosine-5-methyltransferase 1"